MEYRHSLCEEAMLGRSEPHVEECSWIPISNRLQNNENWIKHLNVRPEKPILLVKDIEQINQDTGTHKLQILL